MSASSGHQDTWFREMFYSSPVGMALSDERGHFLLVNDAYCALAGRAEADLIGRSAQEHWHPADYEKHASVEALMTDAAGRPIQLETRFVRPDESVRWAWLSLAPFAGPEGRKWTMAVVHDITSRQEREDGLARASITDNLTGAMNRRGWSQFAANHDAGQELAEQPVAVAIVDFDHFKRVNDTLGHAAGDDVLIGFSLAVRSALGPDDSFTRWGGEEFVITVARGSCADLERLLCTVAGDQRFSAGCTERRRGESLDETLERADALLYEAKRAGRNRVLSDH